MARHSDDGKNTVEGCRSIDVLEWHRLGYLRSPRWFSCAWTRDGERVASINVETQRHSLTLKYQSRSWGEDWSNVEQRVAIQWTPCRFGGERPWFVCSVAANGVYCGRRVTKLYGAERLFACRHCYRLAYASQHEPARRRGLGKSQKIRMRLGGSPNMLEDDDEVMLYAFDLLALEGDDLRKLPLHLRKNNLARLLARRPEGIFVSDYERGEIGPDLFRQACKFGLEGLVSKRRDRPYRGGRSPDWIKVKNRSHPAMERVKEAFS